MSIYYRLSLLNAHTMFLTVHIFMNVNKLLLKARGERDGRGRDSQTEKQKVGDGAGWLRGGGGGVREAGAIQISWRFCGSLTSALTSLSAASSALGIIRPLESVLTLTTLSTPSPSRAAPFAME